MRKALLLIAGLSSLGFSMGPKYSFQDPKLNAEFDNAYHDIGKVANGTYKSSSMTLLGITATSATFTTASITNLNGTTTSGGAEAGTVGEYLSSTSDATVVAGLSGVFSDITSISLTAGDWSVTGIAIMDWNGATGAIPRLGISITAGNSSTGLAYADNYIYGSGTISALPMTIPSWRLALNQTTTVYLKQMWTYTGSTPQTVGHRLSARRER